MDKEKRFEIPYLTLIIYLKYHMNNKVGFFIFFIILKLYNNLS